ncbi:RTA1 like protein-domain-containing protein [Suillus discolor]|uniref:RTA1 like protein-domain-containing protein n=1 Tax=Suillus discolor TaxID=1912936 RepID=A0A9P7JTT2_9AGAM|nr:RTA1 like protein-domain-containing protein [Suillus discolor]KAG2107899.1 RTA1 like protein-domain-containing protein [Suillus discolor]
MTRSILTTSNSTQCPSDPYLDPRNDPCNPLGYIASIPPTAVAFSLVLLIAFAQTYRIIYNGARWMWPMVVGEYSTSQSHAFYVIGFGFRFALHYNPDSLVIYIVEYLLIVLSPCFFIAANYVLLGRLARDIGCTYQVLLPVRRLTLIFILSDVTTFVIQAAGASMTTSTVHNSALIGLHVFLAGLVVQLASFLFFCVIFARLLYKVHAEVQVIWMQDSKQHWNSDWRTLAAAMAISCVGILIRSCYRVAEAAQGFEGSLASSEIAFYLGDTLPLLVAIGIYVPFWPGRFITAKLAPSANESQDGQELAFSRSDLGYNHEVRTGVLSD